METMETMGAIGPGVAFPRVARRGELKGQQAYDSKGASIPCAARTRRPPGKLGGTMGGGIPVWRGRGEPRGQQAYDSKGASIPCVARVGRPPGKLGGTVKVTGAIGW
ncbi:MAG: hypothetical protein IKR48_06625 [Kiritimatiellae bacterium]|nr:hypothetical protein [Kiritimatiellia bacterium]